MVYYHSTKNGASTLPTVLLNNGKKLLRIPSGNSVMGKLVSNQQHMSTASSSLPKLPVPDLNQSLEELKSSAGSFAVSQEEFSEFCLLVNKFNESTGPKLHELLKQKASKTDNWLSNDWWLNKAYLEGRDPLIIWSNPGLICPRIDVPKGVENTLNYITHLVMGVLDFREFLKRGENPEPGVSESCMNQYTKVFGTTRIPGVDKDQIRFGNLQEDTQKISFIISRRGNFYRVTLPNKISEEETRRFLSQVFNSILFHEDVDHDSGSDLGSLTSLPRNEWAQFFSKLDSNSVNSIIESQFVLSLDHVSDDQEFDSNWSESMGRQILHADSENIGNRWFDKTIQVIVVMNKSGQRILGSGLCYEHTPAEGPPIVRLMEHAMRYLAKESAKGSSSISGYDKWAPPSPDYSLSQLNFKTSDADVQKGLEAGKQFHKQLTSSIDLRVLDFNDYGKNLIKSFKVSPDSYIQVAINWSYQRLHKSIGACYESASTRKFQFGRTECIRSVTPEFFLFTLDPNIETLKKAVESHRNTVKRASEGRGIDRLLLGLSTAGHEVKSKIWEWGNPSVVITDEDMDILDKLYKNDLFIRSKYFKLSTSQVSTIFPDSFMIYGPLVTLGYGCCYNPSKERITFGISAFNDLAGEASPTNAQKYKECLKDTLLIMRNMFVSSSSRL